MINKKLAYQIQVMIDVDQSARKEVMRKIKNRELHKIEGNLVYIIDQLHNLKIKEIITKYGYPTQKILGRKGMYNFWLLVQHQDQDIDLQKVCLEKCDFKNKEKAYLVDRIMTKEEGKQLYGTQFMVNKKSGKSRPFPIKDRKNLEKRRKEMGLETFAAYIKRMSK